MPRPKNERNTEQLVRRALEKAGFYDERDASSIEEQKTVIAAAARLLKAASKSGKGGKGAPEFIISNPTDPDFLIVIECKASSGDHASKTIPKFLDGSYLQEDEATYAKRVQRFAADGALHYAKALSREYNVIAVAVTGETHATLEIDNYLYPKGATNPQKLKTKHRVNVDRILSWADYIEHATFDASIQRLRNDELMAFARDLHDFMRDHAKLTESEKPLMVSGTLIAFRNKAFASSFQDYSPAELQQEWLTVIRKEIEKAEIPKAKKNLMVQPYSSIAVHPELGKSTKNYPKGVLNELITRLNEKVWPFISLYHDFDVVGQFYGEFLKYTGGDKKALGIVLTPRHVTELFALLANVNKKSRCLDICAGTGGFLISAMVQMLRSASTLAEQKKIRASGLIGVEQLPNMYALAASNMILRGDGKANLYQGSCFDSAIEKEIKAHKANIGLLNPPFSQGDADLHEMVFVKHMLDCLAPGGTGVAIVPMSCAIAPHPTRVEVLKYHTLEAVMSMPDDLFYPVGTVTCVMVFTAHRPHLDSNRKTWFGYWKSDGFFKTKHRGRIDLLGTWPVTRDRWVETFRNREVHSGESVTRRVGPGDEWCAEAYMETDYSRITQADFERVVRNHAVFELLGAPSSNGADIEEVGDATVE
jgi:16S rRNA G966 N2-methylase RsmD